jgi:uncharacterized membrane protein
MCDWSSWKWLCEGHYELALTILLAITSVVALTIMAILGIDSRRKTDTRDKALDDLRDALCRGEISSDDFLKKCNEVSTKSAFFKNQVMWRR